MRGSHIFWLSTGLALYGYFLYLLFGKLPSATGREERLIISCILTCIGVPLFIWENVVVIWRSDPYCKEAWPKVSVVYLLGFLLRKFNKFLDKNVGA